MSIHSFSQGKLLDKPSALALAKFSYATTSAERSAPVNWTHLAGDPTLKVVFERVQICDSSFENAHERRVLKILKGFDILEVLDLNALVEEISGKVQPSQLQNLKPSAAVIIKSPCLAVRYPMQDNQVRRFQIKFSLEADYYKALAILCEIGCPITESLSGPHQPHISRMASFSSQAPSGLSVYTGNRSVDASKVTASSLQNTCNVSHREMPARDSTLEQLSRRSVCDVDNDDSRVSIISSASSTTACDSRSESKSLCLPHTIQHSSQELHSNSQRAFSYNCYLPSDEANACRAQSQPASSVTHSSPSLQNANSLSDILPPKRELPFVKPPSKKKARSSIQGTPRKICSASIATSRSTKSTADNLRTSCQVGSPRGKTTSAEGNQNPASEAEAMCSPEDREGISSRSPLPGKTHQAGQGKHTSLEHLNLVDQPSLPGNVPQAPDFSTSEQAPVSADTCYDLADFPRGGPRPAPSADNNPPPTRAQFTEPPNRPPFPGSFNAGILTASDLSAYMQTPTPERSAFIESWVCQQLQDDGFLTFCEDVEGVWRRIAFGR